MIVEEVPLSLGWSSRMSDKVGGVEKETRVIDESREGLSLRLRFILGAVVQTELSSGSDDT